MIRRVGENMLQSADDHQSGKHVTRYTPLDKGSNQEWALEIDRTRKISLNVLGPKNTRMCLPCTEKEWSLKTHTRQIKYA